jgi:hypothetical protein
MANRSVAFPIIFLSLGFGLGAQQKQAPSPDLFEFAVVLKAMREYCLKLEKAALDFVCLEEIKEEINLSRIPLAIDRMRFRPISCSASAQTSGTHPALDKVRMSSATTRISLIINSFVRPVRSKKSGLCSKKMEKSGREGRASGTADVSLRRRPARSRPTPR